MTESLTAVKNSPHIACSAAIEEQLSGKSQTANVGLKEGYEHECVTATPSLSLSPLFLYPLTRSPTLRPSPPFLAFFPFLLSDILVITMSALHRPCLHPILGLLCAHAERARLTSISDC